MGEGFFFPSRGHRLYGFLESSSVSPGRDEGALLVHPFMEERQDAHPILRDMARRLAGTGFPTLRFDLHGHGDSEGDWQDATIEGWLEDIATAAEVLRREAGVRRIGLYGLRFGATLAALAARVLQPEHLVLWQPVIRGEAYVMDLLMSHLAAEMVLHKRAGISREVLIERLGQGQNVNLFGYLFSPAQYRGSRPLTSPGISGGTRAVRSCWTSCAPRLPGTMPTPAPSRPSWVSVLPSAGPWRHR